ncbi:MAG: HDIG domain-containing metalloprotein [bacterium]
MAQTTGSAKASGKSKNGTTRLHHQRGGRWRPVFASALESDLFPWVLGTLLVVFLSALMTTGLSVTSVSYQGGDIARRDIKAPRDMRVEDIAASGPLRQKARDRVPPHYDIDSKQREKIERQIRSAFEQIQKALIEQSAAVRNRLLGLRAEKKQGALIGESMVFRELFLSPVFRAEEINFGRILGGELSPALLAFLRKERYASWIGEDMARLARAVLGRGVVSDNHLYAIHNAKGIIFRDIQTGSRVPFSALPKPLELREVEGFLLRQAGGLGLRTEAPSRPLLAAQAANLIQPTLNFNIQATAEAQRVAAAKVPSVSHVIKDGEMIVREGERITENHLMTLRALEREGRQSHVVDNFLGTALLVTIFLIFAWTAAQRYDLGILSEPKSIGLFVLLLASQAALIKGGVLLAHEFQESSGGIDVGAYYFIIPLATASMLAAILQGRSTAILMAIMSAVVAGLMLPGKVYLTLLALEGGVYAAINWKGYRHRTSILIAGLMIGVANAVLVFGFNLQEGLNFAMARWMDAPLAFAGGIANIIVVSAVMPLLESAFKVTTDMKLIELSDQNHPLLRQLVVRAPGTYHHSLMVGNLAEEACEAVGANPLLARVGAYFHDVGKIVKPEYFVENQDTVNRHDKLSPSMSSLILISHVKEGLEMARTYKLPKEITDLICQHHGTSLIRYFFEKAKEQESSDQEVREEIFRYPGPRPQSREAGIMMLADMTEAASRSLPDTSPAHLAGLVERIFQMAFSDGQLDECDLTLRHLSQIQEAFLRVLAGIYHHRVIYPEQPSPERKGANGDLHHKPAKEGAHRPRTAAQAGGGGSRKSPVS